ncbi:MAG: glycosyltransferase family 4 protein [Actinomycetia bacterium]|nr:glycosyltransferase family 4 protein [Actinomycetes bacterium]
MLTRHERFDTERYDAAQPFPVHRVPGPLLPTPRLERRAVELARRYGTDRLLIGASVPLGLLARRLRPYAERIVALSHGHEVWWASVPVAATALRRVAADVDALGVISGHTHQVIARALPEADRAKLVELPPPVDTTRFCPASELAPDPVVVSAGRLVRQKGFDTLLAAWPTVLAGLPAARLLIVGDGPAAGRLRRQAAWLTGVRFLGDQPHHRMPDLYQSARVFALPVQRLLGGLYTEGRGLVFAEAAACGLPVVVGDSGGAPETLQDGLTGTVVPPADPALLAGALLRYLADPVAARAAGLAGREHVVGTCDTATVAGRLRAVLAA